MNTQKITGYPSIDKPWMKYYPNSEKKCTVPETTIYQYIYDRNKDYMNDNALMYYGCRISYKKLFAMVDRIAGVLSAQKVVEGDSILLCSTQTPETLYLLMACSKLGICTIMINPTLKEEQIKKIVEESKAKYLFCLDKLYGVVKSVVKENENITTVIIPAAASLSFAVRILMADRQNKIYEEKIIAWKNFLQMKVTAGKLVKTCQNNLVVVFSSGTTGEAKGIVHTNQSYVAMVAEYQNSGYPFQRGDIFLNHIPAFIASGLSYLLMVPLAFGVCVMLEPVYQVDVFAKDIKKYKPDIVAPTKSFWIEASKNGLLKKKDLKCVKIPATGGEPINEYDVKRLNELLHMYGCKQNMYIGYGMSELNGTAVATPIKGGTLGSVGIPLPSMIVSAFNMDTGNECKYEEYGEIRIQTPCHMKEYYHNPELTQYFFWTDKEENVWCRTGDVGYVNANGEIFVCGRTTESVQLESGKYVYFFEIEKIIQKEPEVAQCRIAYIEERNEWLVNLVLNVDVQKNIFYKKLDQVFERVTGKREPINYKLYKAFPLTPNGKCDMRMMKENFIKER